jgi:Zn finger protein HypA/HybF involved in hydrogenase expression
MHDALYIQNLLATLEQKAKEHKAKGILRVRVLLGREAKFDPDHFKEDFDIFKRSTLAENTEIEIQLCDGREIILKEVELEF